MELDASYLKQRIALEAVEAQYDFRNSPSDFREDWERLLAKRQDGDELWTFEPPPRSMRFWGIALVRNGRVISTLIEAVD